MAAETVPPTASVPPAERLAASPKYDPTAPGKPPSPPPPASARPRLKPIPLERLDVTLGRFAPAPGGRYRVESPKLRAVAPANRRSTAALRFTYLGSTASIAPLASGEERRQLGLKLRARDGCNLLYVMWRLAPVPGVVVQVKQNPGASTSAVCGARGYRTVRPLRSHPPPTLVAGATHVLEARLTDTRLSVEIDGSVVWEGQVDPRAAALEGPIGLRTDNVRCEMELLGEEE
jgi:hypothetical protein